MPEEKRPVPGDPFASLPRGPAGGAEYPIGPNVPRGELPEPVSGGRPRSQDGTPRSRFGDFWALMGCNAIVFGTSVCLMVLELTASRLIAGYLGSSLYTWTSVIGVVLAGISLGNFCGGWLADRLAPQKILGWLFVLAGMTTLSVLLLNNLLARAPRPENLDWQWWVMLVVACEFLLPAVSLGTISPVVASMAIKRSARTGITVGNIYAWGAMGSIVGTFLTGFWLIGAYGTKQIIWMTAAALLIMGAMVAGGQRAFRMMVLFGLVQFVVVVGLLSSTTSYQTESAIRSVAGIRSGWKTDDSHFAADDEAIQAAEELRDEAALAAARERKEWRQERKTNEEEWGAWGRSLGMQLHLLGRTLKLRLDDPREYNDESDYYAINVSDAVSGEDPVRELRLDYLIHSYYSPDCPTKLFYDYERVYAAITERAAAQWGRRADVALEQLPAGEAQGTGEAPQGGNDPAADWPEGVRYDPADRRLSVTGGMTFPQLRALLARGKDGEFRLALLKLWEDAEQNLARTLRRGDSALYVPLGAMPAGVKFPKESAKKLRYDAARKALACSETLTLSTALALMAQGEEAAYVKGVAELFGRSRRTSSLFIGGGGFVFPRWIESRFPQQPLIDVAEIDPRVKLAVELAMGLPDEFGSPEEGKTFVRTHVGDARTFVDEASRRNEALRKEGQPPVTYDYVYGDAFNDLSVPWHLTTREFGAKVRDLLTPEEGVYLVNIIDIFPRALYPSAATRVGEGTVTVADGMPAALLPDNLPADGFVPVRGPFPHLEVSRSGQQHKLRYSAVMTDEVRDALTRLDSDRSKDAKYTTAIDRLYKRTRARQRLVDPPPPEIFPDPIPTDTWHVATGAARGLEIFQDDNGYSYGYRGVMSDRRRDELLALAPGNRSYETAIRELHRSSHAERVGQFLGRYVRTARENFPNVYVFTSTESDGPPGDNRDTYIVACSLRKLDFQDLEAAGGHWRSGPFAWSEKDATGGDVEGGAMASLLELSRGKLLEDNYAPVDNLLAPVFVRRSGD